MSTLEHRRSGPARTPLAAAAVAALGGGALVRLRARERRAHAQRLAREDDLLATLAGRLDAAESALREHDARMHEVTATVAGIAAAAEVLSLVGDARATLEASMLAEIGRLQRLLGDGDPDAGRHRGEVLDLDDVVTPLVTAHRARGRCVAWRPTGLRARGRADAVAEALNVLLDNAARHGAADDIAVEVRRVGDRVEVAVSDGGPGVHRWLGERVFAWGERRPGSPGRGIGLAVARQRLRDCGGDVRLDRGVRTRFVIALPATPGRALRVVDPAEVLAG